MLGDEEGFEVLWGVFERVSVWHIDQQYKCFQGDHFTRVDSKLDIQVGVRNHVSACCDNYKEGQYSNMNFLPKPHVEFHGTKPGSETKMTVEAFLLLD